MKQSGQILILLLLVMLVSLTMALAIAQRSLTYLSTSNKSEQSNRAFSAAQAGIDQALNSNVAPTSIPLLSNQSSAITPSSPPLPPPSPQTGYDEAIEYPPIGKDTPAQFWLADPYSLSFPVTAASSGFSHANQFQVYYGNVNLNNSSDPSNYSILKSNGDAPAVEVNYVTYNGTTYLSHKYYYDDSSLRRGNGFASSTCLLSGSAITTTNNSSGQKDTFACHTDPLPPSSLPNTEAPIMVRVRLLYSDVSQSIALAPISPAYFPPQVQILNSTGYSGQTQRKIRVFKAPFVVPPFFDYAIFSQTDIKK